MTPITTYHLTPRKSKGICDVFATTAGNVEQVGIVTHVNTSGLQQWQAQIDSHIGHGKTASAALNAAVCALRVARK